MGRGVLGESNNFVVEEEEEVEDVVEEMAKDQESVGVKEKGKGGRMVELAEKEGLGGGEGQKVVVCVR